MPLTFHQHQLKNGLDVIAEVNPDSYSTAMGLFVRTGAQGKPMVRKEPYNVVEVDYGDGTPIQTYVELSCGLGLSRGVERQEVYDATSSRRSSR